MNVYITQELLKSNISRCDVIGSYFYFQANYTLCTYGRLKAIVVLVNWNGFASIFQKVQYFHSRH